MKPILLLFLGLSTASGLAWLWLTRSPTTTLVDASGRDLTAGSEPLPEDADAPAGPGPDAADALDPFDEASALLEEREFERAKERLLALLEESDRDGEGCILLSHATRELGQVEQAVDYGLKAVELLPESARARVAHAQAIGAQVMKDARTLMGILKAKPRIDRFRSEIDRAIELDPENVEARKLLTMYHMAPEPFGDLDRALELCDDIEALDPIAGKLWRANVRIRREEVDEAIALCRAGIEEHPEVQHFHVVLGDVYARQERYEDAEAQYVQAAVGEDRTDALLARFSRAKLRVTHDVELERAVELLGAYVAADPQGTFLPSIAHALWWQGQALEGLGRVEEARAAYEESRRLDPDFAEPRQALEALGSSE